MKRYHAEPASAGIDALSTSAASAAAMSKSVFNIESPRLALPELTYWLAFRDSYFVSVETCSYQTQTGGTNQNHVTDPVPVVLFLVP